MNDEELSKLTDIFRTTFNQSELVLTDNMTAADVPGWDSLNHVTLMLHIETAFRVRFGNDEVAELKNVGELIGLIDAKTTR